jgi:hypothetical protein
VFNFVLISLLIIPVVETKDGTVSVAAAFAGHQEGNASACISELFFFLQFFTKIANGWLIDPLRFEAWIVNDIMLLLGLVISEHGYQIYIQIVNRKTYF